MSPQSPVLFQVANSKKYEVVFGKDQPEYIPLPAYVITDYPQKETISRWKLSWKERIFALIFGNLWTSQYTFGKPFQPIRPTVFESYTKWDK